jgi:hypothetical protein
MVYVQEHKLFSAPVNDKRAIVDSHRVQYKRSFAYNDAPSGEQGNSAPALRAQGQAQLLIDFWWVVILQPAVFPDTTYFCQSAGTPFL